MKSSAGRLLLSWIPRLCSDWVEADKMEGGRGRVACTLWS